MSQLENLLSHGKARMSCSARVLVVLIAATVSLALPTIAPAQQSAKAAEKPQGTIQGRLAKIAQQGAPSETT